MKELELIQKALSKTNQSIDKTFEINEFSIEEVLEVMDSIDQILIFLHSDDLTNEVSPYVKNLLSFKGGLKYAVYEQINSII